METTKLATSQTIFLGLRYEDGHAAIAWLERAFGAERRVVYDSPSGGVAHAELAIAGNIVMLGDNHDDGDTASLRQTRAAGPGLYVALADAVAVDALYARAVAAGATVTSPPSDTDYGSHDVRVLDLEGYPWTFGTYKPGA